MKDRTKRITVSLTEETYEELRRFAFESRSSLSKALMILCEEGLAVRRQVANEENASERNVKR